MANKKKYKTIPYWGHRYFRYKPEKNKDKIGLTEEQQKIEKIFDYAKGVSLDVFNYDRKDESKSEKKSKIKDEFIKKYPNLNFDEVRQSRENISNAITSGNVTDDELGEICKKVLSWVPNEYFNGIEMKEFKFYTEIRGYVGGIAVVAGILSYKDMSVRLF